jgi:hypothetical protein
MSGRYVGKEKFAPQLGMSIGRAGAALRPGGHFNLGLKSGSVCFGTVALTAPDLTLATKSHTWRPSFECV